MMCTDGSDLWTSTKYTIQAMLDIKGCSPSCIKHKGNVQINKPIDKSKLVTHQSLANVVATRFKQIVTMTDIYTTLLIVTRLADNKGHHPTPKKKLHTSQKASVPGSINDTESV